MMLMLLAIAVVQAAVVQAAVVQAAAVAKPIPTIPEQFTLHTTEVDDTNHGAISVKQTIYFDTKNRRSHMVRDLSLFLLFSIQSCFVFLTSEQ